MISLCSRDGPRKVRSAERGVHERALPPPRSALSGVRRQLGYLLPVLCLLAPCTVGAYFLGRYAWIRYHWQAAQAALKQHEFVQAQEHLKHCLAIRGDAATEFLAARTARRAGDYNEAAY